MKHHISLSLVFLALCTPVFAASAKEWAKLKTDMTPDEALALLGHPLFRNVNRGYEVWIYDSKAEVVFHGGPVMAWTIPTPNPVSEARPLSMDLPLNPPKRLPQFVSRKILQNSTVGEVAPIPSTSFRYRQSR